MPGKVRLEVLRGQLQTRAFTFEEHDTFLFGRAPDSTACLPDDPAVSRRHFLLEANPPDARIRDLGSMSGTYVNGVKYGGRNEGETPEEGARRTYPEVDLKDGDRILAGDTELCVRLEAEAVCAHCCAPIADGERGRCAGAGGAFLCDPCRRKLAASGQKAKPPEPARCQKCGKDVAEEVGPNRRGAYICQSCRRKVANDPMEALVEAMLKMGLLRGSEKVPEVAGYRVGECLAVGGFGAVYLATRQSDGARVAIKVMLSRVAVDEKSRMRFEREIALTRALSHPNIVSLLDHGSAGGAFYFVMEFCDGGSARGLMAQRGGRLTLFEAGPLVLQALDGLAYAHGKDCVHRDLKPDNILLTTSGGRCVAKLSDFGLAKSFQKLGFSGITLSDEVAGTPGFMPPEQVSSFKRVRPPGDVWSMGATLYNMLTGQLPLDFARGRDPMEVILDCALIPIRRRMPGLPGRVADVIDRALARDPDARYQNAGELRQALERAL